MEEGLGKFLKQARAEGFALGAFNLDTLDTLIAVANAAKNLHAPVLAEVSPGEVSSFKMRNLSSLIDNTKREFGIPLFLNLDHAEDMDVIEDALNFGFDLVHYDGSVLPLEENISNAKRVVEFAHAKGVMVEGEINHFPGASEVFKTQEAGTNQLTDPESAKRFVGETGVDIFAVFIGNKHGVYQDGSEKLDIAHLEKLRAALPDTFFSLHGGSGIPQEDVKEAIKRGVVKVNVNTELRVAFRQGLEESLKNSPDEFAWYKLNEIAIKSVKKVVEDKIAIFNSEGKNGTANN